MDITVGPAPDHTGDGRPEALLAAAGAGVRRCKTWGVANGSESPVTSLIGIYDADGTVIGELRYWVGAHLTGTAHCALCEITHGLFREKAGWREVVEAMPVPFEAVHLDERSPAVVEASDGLTPCVLASCADGALAMLLGPEDLETMGGEPSRLAAALSEALRRRYPSQFAPT